MQSDFEQRKSAPYAELDPLARAAMRFVKSWHRHPDLHEALWYHGVNLGETDEFLLFCDVMRALHEEGFGTAPTAAPEWRAATPRGADLPLPESFPAARPEIAGAWAAAVPQDAARVVVAADRRDAQDLVDRLQLAMPSGTFVTAESPASLEAQSPGSADAILLPGPLPHSPSAQALLRRAAEVCRPDGTVAALFDTAASAANFPWSEQGVMQILARTGLRRLSIRLVEDRFLLTTATVASRQSGPLAETLHGRRMQAEAENERGEALFESGDPGGALRCFAAALQWVPDGALYHSNAGTALFHLGRHEDAWDKFIDALHFDPSCEGARVNLSSLAPLLDRQHEAERLLRLFPQ